MAALPHCPTARLRGGPRRLCVCCPRTISTSLAQCFSSGLKRSHRSSLHNQRWTARLRSSGADGEDLSRGERSPEAVVSASAPGAALQQVAVALAEEDDVSPLRNALERASQRKEKATEYRLSVEHEAQNVAQLAVKEGELLQAAQKELEEARAEVVEVEATMAQILDRVHHLQDELAQAIEEKQPLREEFDSEQDRAWRAAEIADKMVKLERVVASEQAAAQQLEEEAAEERPQGTEAAAAAEAGEEDASKGGVGGQAPSEAAAKPVPKEECDKCRTLALTISSCRKELRQLEAALAQRQETRLELEAAAADAEDRSLQAERRASLVMQEAESAVLDEMEAEAVVEQIRLAFQKATEQLQAMVQQSKVLPGSEKGAAAAEEAGAHEDQDVHGGGDATSSTDPTATVMSSVDLVTLVQVAPAEEKAADCAASTAKKLLEAKDAAVSPVAQAADALARRWRLLLGGALLCGVLAVLVVNTDVVQFVVAKASALFAAAGARLQALKDVLGRIPINIVEGEEGLLETIALLLTSVLSVPLVLKFVPGGSAVLGFLLGGALIGPHALGIIQDVEQIRHLAELGVVFLLFNIGLELSLERLQRMGKFVFGLGNLHFLLSLAAIAGVALASSGVTGPGSIILGGALALSSTAVAMQVLADRGESGAKHGRATFSVLLLQDLVVVVMLMLVPLLAGGGGSVGLATIAKALSLAGVKAALCIAGIIAGGRVVLRPIYRRISSLHNAEIFAATTLLVVLGTSVLTQLAGLSLALGAFLAGLCVAETEFALQVESDIAPFKGLLMGLFFMSVGMEISMGLLLAELKTVALAMVLLLAGKTAIMAMVGPLFGLSRLSSMRSGLYLAPGGEFAFVILGDAVSRGVLPPKLVNVLFIAVVLSMAITPYLAAFGSWLGKQFESKNMKDLQPQEQETAAMRDHVIIAGFGRVGQVIAQVLSENFIPYIALDVRADRVSVGKESDLPVYFGDAGSPAVLHAVNAHRAKCAVITLDTPGGNYRTVWAIAKNFPNIKIYCRAHDVDHGLNLEKAGATVVVPETLEPSLQLASAVLGTMNMSRADVIDILDSFRENHMSELAMLSKVSGSTLGYGFDVVSMGSSDDEPETVDGNVAAKQPPLPAAQPKPKAAASEGDSKPGRNPPLVPAA